MGTDPGSGPKRVQRGIAPPPPAKVLRASQKKNIVETKGLKRVKMLTGWIGVQVGGWRRDGRVAGEGDKGGGKTQAQLPQDKCTIVQ